MSDLLKPFRRSSLAESQEDVKLEPFLETTLRDGIRALPAPKTEADFNRRVLASLTSGRDFDPLGRQIRTRLRWMALPACVGFGLALGAGFWHIYRFPALPAPQPIPADVRNAPPLLPMPARIVPPKMPRTLEELKKLSSPVKGVGVGGARGMSMMDGGGMAGRGAMPPRAALRAQGLPAPVTFPGRGAPPPASGRASAAPVHGRASLSAGTPANPVQEQGK